MCCKVIMGKGIFQIILKKDGSKILSNLSLIFNFFDIAHSSCMINIES